MLGGRGGEGSGGGGSVLVRTRRGGDVRKWRWPLVVFRVYEGWEVKKGFSATDSNLKAGTNMI